MIIKGNRRGGARQLAAHLLRRDTNEEVHVRDLGDYPGKSLSDQALTRALRIMESHGTSLAKSRTLYHAIIAPQDGEQLNDKQLNHAVETLAHNLGLSGHNRVIVEHRKAGRQHFHVVFNILDMNGKQARLQWTRKQEWAVARQLEQELSLKPVKPQGRPTRRWEHQRGNRSGIDPLKVRKQVTAIYNASRTGKEFVAELEKAGYVLTRGRNGSYVLVDKAGHIHGLMRRIEGAKLNDLRQRFPDMGRMALPPLELALKAVKAKPVTKTGQKRTVGNRYRPVHHRPGVSRTPQMYRGMTGYYPVPVLRTPSYDALRTVAAYITQPRKRAKDGADLSPVRPVSYTSEMDASEIIAWAFKNGRLDILALYGIFLPPEYFEP